jgi:hypothetical protein
MASKLRRNAAGRPWNLSSRLAGSSGKTRHLGRSGKNRIEGMLTYHDKGRTRIKPRYVWAAWAFVIGAVLGVLAAYL